MNDIQFVTKIHALEIDARHRHPRIIEVFDGLASGEFMELSNDHNPKPLHYQLMIEREGEFSWEYLEQGPSVWRLERSDC